MDTDLRFFLKPDSFHKYLYKTTYMLLISTCGDFMPKLKLDFHLTNSWVVFSNKRKMNFFTSSYIDFHVHATSQLPGGLMSGFSP